MATKGKEYPTETPSPTPAPPFQNAESLDPDAQAPPEEAAPTLRAAATPVTSVLPTLADVSNWFYMINVNLEDGMVDQIAAAEYDVVVLDYIPSEAENTDYPMAEVIEKLH